MADLPEDEVFALPIDAPIPEDQPVPPPHPNRRVAMERAYRIAAERVGAEFSAELDAWRDADPPELCVVSSTGFHDDVPALLDLLELPHVVVVEHPARAGEGVRTLPSARLYIAQCVGPGSGGSEGLRSELAQAVSSGAWLLTTCRALVIAQGIPAADPESDGGSRGGAPGAVAEREVAVTPRFTTPVGDRSGGVGAGVRWQVDGGSPELAGIGEWELLAHAAEAVPGWTTDGAHPLWARRAHGRGGMHHLTMHLWMTWSGESAGDPWGVGDAGEDPTTAEIASAESILWVLLEVLGDALGRAADGS